MSRGVDVNYGNGTTQYGVTSLNAGAGIAASFLNTGAAQFAADFTVAPVVTAERTFTETTGAGTYTATVAIPAGATVLDVIWRNTAVWTATTSATLNVGDDDGAGGYISAMNVKTTPAADTTGVGGVNTLTSDTGTGAFKGGGGKFCATAKTITATVVTVGGAGNAGRSRLLVVYVLPLTSTAASKA